MSRNLHPTEGARFLLERTAAHGARATYRAQIYTPTAVYTTTANLDDSGAVDVPPAGAPDDLDARLASIARLVARDAAKRREDGLVAWPARILRWRK